MTRRFGYVSVVRHGKFVLFGRFDGSRWLNDRYIFHVPTATWTEIQALGTLPSARSCPAWAKEGSCVYITGGYDGVERKSDFFCLDLYAAKMLGEREVKIIEVGLGVHAKRACDEIKTFQRRLVKPLLERMGERDRFLRSDGYFAGA